MDTASLLPIIGTLGIVGGLWAVARLLKRAGPPQSSDWSERDWGDQPNVGVFHNGTPFITEAKQDHV